MNPGTRQSYLVAATLLWFRDYVQTITKDAIDTLFQYLSAPYRVHALTQGYCTAVPPRAGLTSRMTPLQAVTLGHS